MLSTEEALAELRLFKSYSDHRNVGVSINNLISNGIIINDLKHRPDGGLQQLIIDLFGVNANTINNTFHKSFQTVINSNKEELFIQAVLHYISVAADDIFNTDIVYVPYEQLDVPELKENVVFNVIKYIDYEELGNKLKDLVCSNIALSNSTLEDIKTLYKYIPQSCIQQIKNREIQVFLYDKLDCIPTDAQTFIKYIIYKLTKSTMIIKSQELYNKIVESDKSILYTIFKRYERMYSKDELIKSLSKYFLRYRKLILALKVKQSYNSPYKEYINNIINKARKYADRNKVEYESKYIDKLFKITKCKEVFSLANVKEKIQQEAKSETIFHLVRVYNYITYELASPKVKVYKIRNGKLYVKENDNEILEDQRLLLYDCQQVIYEEICNRVKARLKDKIIYIPQNIDYKLPSSEKQFIGYIPEGTQLLINKDNNLVITVHWNNVQHSRIDLDLSAVCDGQLVSWNSTYKLNNDDIVFSGDMTRPDIVNGASESIMVKSFTARTSPVLLQLTDFTNTGLTIPYDLIISYLKEDQLSKNYIVNPNNIVYKINTSLSPLGSLSTIASVNKYSDELYSVVLFNYCLGRKNIASSSTLTSLLCEYFKLYYKLKLSLEKVLKDCNIQVIHSYLMQQQTITETLLDNEIVDKKMETKIIEPDIDLSISKLTKSTFIDMLKGV